MSTKVSYKGAQIAEVGTQQTKTLLTAGKYCEGDITLIDDSNPIAEENDVIFIDYDGTIRYSYSADEFLALTELPPNPVHEGLTAQGWNWTLEDAKEYVGKYKEHCIGQTYDTTDGALHVFLTVSKDQLSYTIGIRILCKSNGSGAINWGDGNTTNFSNDSWQVYTHTYTPGHQYEFTVSKITGVVQIGGYQSGIFKNNIQLIDEIHFGSGVEVQVDGNGCNNCINLKAISAPKGYQFLFNFVFRNCISLRACVISGIRNESLLLSWTFYRCVNLRYVSLHKISLARSISTFFYSQSGIKSIVIPDGITTIDDSFASDAIGLQNVIISDTVQTIGAYAFIDLPNILQICFYATTPPTLSTRYSLTDLGNNCKIFVPFSALAAYLTGTNYPNPASYTYLGFATYASGATLPTQDSTEAYNVTWYASKADAIAETDAITEGNGKEIYCRYTAVS